MKQILHHMRDLGAAFGRAIDVVVINRVFGEVAGEARAVAGFRRARELFQQSCELVAGHVASLCLLEAASLGDTTTIFEYDSAIPRRDAPEVLQKPFAPRDNRGRRECRALNAPAASCVKKQTHELVTTVTPDSPGSPRAMVLRLTSCSPR